MVYHLDGEVWLILGEGDGVVILRLALTRLPDETLTYIGQAPKKDIDRPAHSR